MRRKKNCLARDARKIIRFKCYLSIMRHWNHFLYYNLALFIPAFCSLFLSFFLNFIPIISERKNWMRSWWKMFWQLNLIAPTKMKQQIPHKQVPNVIHCKLVSHPSTAANKRITPFWTVETVWGREREREGERLNNDACLLITRSRFVELPFLALSRAHTQKKIKLKVFL